MENKEKKQICALYLPPPHILCKMLQKRSDELLQISNKKEIKSGPGNN